MSTLEVRANDDGTYKVILEGELRGSAIPEEWLNAELCGKLGFCGEEFEEIKRQLAASGRASLTV